MVERPAAYLLSRSSGCIRSRNWSSNWTYRLRCRTSRSRTAAAAAPAARRRTGDRTALLRAGAGTGAGGICGRRAADRAGRLLAAGIAAPLLDEVWEYEAAEAAVAGRSHFISLHKRSGNVCSRVILCRKCPNRVGKQQNPDGRTVVRVLDAKIERKLNAWRTAARGELPSSRTARVFELFSLDTPGFSGFLPLSYPVCGP